jgi:hypothetical protein
MEGHGNSGKVFVPFHFLSDQEFQGCWSIARMVMGCSMGLSDPDVRRKLSEPIWLQYKHESDKQKWSWWKQLIHRFQRCPICKPAK